VEAEFEKIGMNAKRFQAIEKILELLDVVILI